MNVLVIMSDEHNAAAAGYEGHPTVRTPNLDALAGAGTRFDAAYTPSPICVPARAAWATGRPVREIGFWDNAMAYDGRVDGWGHVLHQAGVRVESIGKLHYANAAAPTGFDRQTEPMHIAGGVGQVWGSVRDPLPVRRHAELLVSWSGPGETDYTRYDERIADHACRWLQEAGEHPEPFVLYVGFVAPHFPYVAPERFFDLYDPAAVPPAKLHPDTGYRRHPWVEAHARTLEGLDSANTVGERQRCTAAYWGLVSSMDANVGKVLDALQRSGLGDDTLVVYTSDHGENLGARGLWGKSLLYEESTRIPLLLAGPDVPAGRVCRTATSLLDGRRSLLSAAGVDEEPAPDGAGGLTRAWQELASAPTDEDRVVISEYHAFGSPSAGFLLRRGDHKLHHYVGFEPELFDLAADPGELRDLVADPADRAGDERIRRSLEDALTSVLDPEQIDHRAKAAQAALVESFGGREAALHRGTVAETPAPSSAG